MPKALFKPTESFVTINPSTGLKELFHPVMVVTGDHWVLKGRESLFRPVDDATADSGAVEQATSEPGAKRNVTRTK